MAKKRGKLEKREKIQQTLERYRRFDYDYIPFGNRWKVPGADYDYRGSLWLRFYAKFVRTLSLCIANVVIKVLYGAKVTGKENIKALKKQGAICICNHFSYLDNLFIRAAVGQYRSYFTVAPWNNKTGFAGRFLRAGGILPFSPNLAATRNLNDEIARLLGKGKIVNFYAEQAMWVNYQKPRPQKEGAFYYAIKNDVPVLPIFCTFQKSARGHIKKLRINILPPIPVDKSLPRRQETARLKECSEEAWKRCYEENYGIPLEYLSKE